MSSFCKAPFTQMSIDPRGAILPCCRYPKPLAYLKDEKIDDAWNNDNFKELRQRFLDGEKPEECADCWHAEDAGGKSLRWVQNYWAKDMEFDSTEVETPPFFYELKTTNVCNLKCRMCGSFNSSQIAKETETIEVRKHYLSNKIIGTHHEPILKKWLLNSRYILFAGGEPFVNGEIRKIMEYLDENNLLENIHIQIVTNGTHYNDQFVDQFRKIKDFELKISLDDIEERNDYQREGSDFEEIERNIIKFWYDFKGSMEFNCTINWYNIWDIDEFFQFADDYITPVSVQFVENPKFLNITNLPEKVKEKINLKYKNSTDDRIKLILNRMNLQGEDQLENFWKHVNHYDELRDNDFRKTFPEWSNIIDL
tara:strand:- start:1405 stop:2505 length:1101 start_codon:yes stop_codon:yes gene_type:complete